MNKHVPTNREPLASVGLVLRKVGVFTVGLTIALLGVLRELFVSTEIRHDDEGEDRPLTNGSDLFGEQNFRTGNMDSGADPDGWYEEDL